MSYSFHMYFMFSGNALSVPKVAVCSSKKTGKRIVKAFFTPWNEGGDLNDVQGYVLNFMSGPQTLWCCGKCLSVWNGMVCYEMA